MVIKEKIQKNIYLFLGILFIFFPSIVFSIGIIQKNIPDSISATYYSNYNFVMISMMIVMFLIFLILPTTNLLERIINICISLAIILSLIFPKVTNDETQLVGIFKLPSNISDKFHIVFAFIVFLGIAIQFLFFSNRLIEQQKRLFFVLGITIIVFLLIMAIGRTIFQLNNYFPFSLIMETIIFINIGIGYIFKSKVELSL